MSGDGRCQKGNRIVAQKLADRWGEIYGKQVEYWMHYSKHIMS